MRPYSMDLRERVAAAVDDGEGSLREIARLFRVSLSFVSRLLRRRLDTGNLAPRRTVAVPHQYSARTTGDALSNSPESTTTTPWSN